MGEPKWTKGPRTVESRTVGDLFVVVIRGADNTLITRMECSASDPEAVEATMADAALDAAGPDMRAALQPLANMGDLRLYKAICGVLTPTERVSFGCAVQAARDAINKADGKVTP